MNDSRMIALNAIEEKKDLFFALSDEIWALAELSLEETGSAEAFCRLLPELGFSVTKNVSGIPTAFCGSYGQGSPVIGILGEFDALSGLSQEAGSPVRKPLVPGGNGHGCGHNLLGAGALAAAYGIKCFLEASQLPGTVIFFGCPGEEGVASKAFMARDGFWKTLNAALTWHPADANEVVTGSCNSCIQILYRFYGTASHAAASPEQGRSALDAAELMNMGVQFLREHMPADARIHYSFLDAGGPSPNVVQPSASVLYMIRSPLVKDALALKQRVDNIAKGAALMTETLTDQVFVDGLSGTVPNHTLEKLLQEEMEKLPLPDYTEEELAFAAALKQTCPQKIPGIAAAHDKEAAAASAALSDKGRKPLNDFVLPLWTGDHFSAGSTDVGDVSWQTPAVQLHTACFVSGSPGHSWQNVSCGGSSIGHKGLLLAGKVLASAGVRLFTEKALLQAARDEFAAVGEYICPIPEGENARTLAESEKMPPAFSGQMTQ